MAKNIVINKRYKSFSTSLEPVIDKYIVFDPDDSDYTFVERKRLDIVNYENEFGELKLGDIVVKKSDRDEYIQVKDVTKNTVIFTNMKKSH